MRHQSSLILRLKLQLFQQDLNDWLKILIFQQMVLPKMLIYREKPVQVDDYFRFQLDQQLKYYQPKKNS
jgi:hypothetical protein